MAEIIVIAYVSEWKRESTDLHPNWAMKLTEPHYKKSGETSFIAARTYYTVQAGWEVEIDFTKFKVGDKVKVSGKQLMESREWKGKTYNTLTIRADSVELVQSSNSQASAQRAFASGDEPF